MKLSMIITTLLMILLIVISPACFNNAKVSQTADNLSVSSTARQETSENKTDNQNTNTIVSSPKPENQKGNSAILFARWEPPWWDFNHCQIAIVNPDGSNLKLLTPENEICYWADWNPDKSQLIIQSNKDRSWKWESDLFITDQNGNLVSKVTTPGGSGPNGSGPVYKFPSWSPDGTRITYCKSKHSGSTIGHGSSSMPDTYYYNIFVSNSDGSNARQVSNLSFDQNAIFPQWSPDGKSILYLYNEAGFYKFTSYDIETGFPTGYPIQINATYDPLDYPSFSLSPDGTKIVFTSDIYPDFYKRGREIFVYNINTGETIRLTNNNYEDCYPCWSPDGTRIVFTRRDVGGLYIMNSDGSNQIKILNTMAGDIPIRWK